MSSDALVFDIQKFSVHDGPGIRTIVFFKGCPLRCKWCSNPESQKFESELLIYPDKCVGCYRCAEVCEEGCFIKDNKGGFAFDRSKCTNCGKCAEVCYAEARRMSGKLMSIEEIKKEVDKDLIFYRNSGGGITFSGGEAMCFPETVKELAKYYKEVQGVSTAIETCGYVAWENYEMVLPYLDFVMFDLKCIDDERHKEYTGGSNKQILENARRIAKIAKTVIRIPIIPTLNDSVEDIDAFGKFVKELKTVNVIHILPYHDLGLSKYLALGREYMLKGIKAPSDEHMQEIKRQLEGYGFEVNIGG